MTIPPPHPQPAIDDDKAAMDVYHQLSKEDQQKIDTMVLESAMLAAGIDHQGQITSGRTEAQAIGVVDYLLQDQNSIDGSRINVIRELGPTTYSTAEEIHQALHARGTRVDPGVTDGLQPKNIDADVRTSLRFIREKGGMSM